MKLKRLMLIITILIITSCTTTIKSPMTQIEYTGYIKEDGVGVTLKPPFWGWCVQAYKYFTK